MNELVVVAGKSLLISLVLTPIVRDVFRSYNIVDRPGLRKVHVHPIPRVGGIALLIAYVTALITSSESDIFQGFSDGFWGLLPGALVIFAVGLIDDFFSLRPWIKLGGETVAAILVYQAGIPIDGILGTPLPAWLTFPITLFWILLATNAFNLIDGLDGLCTGMGLLATLTLCGTALLNNNLQLAFATLPLAGALLGFLCYNFNPATVFLGDSGALLIGFLLGCYGLLWTQKAATALSLGVPLLALSIPLLDVSLSVLRRFLISTPIFGADRGHIHHRLLDQGLSPRRAVLVLYAAALATAVAAILLSYSRLGGFQNIVILVLSVTVFLGIRQLRYSEFRVARQFLFRGEFQKTISISFRVSKFEAEAMRLTTDEQWWDLLMRAAKEFGWIRVSWHSGSRLRESILDPASASQQTWSLQIAPVPGETILFEGVFDKLQSHTELIPFTGMVGRLLAEYRERVVLASQHA